MDAKELKEAQDNLRKKTDEKKSQNSKVADLLTAGKRIGSKPLRHSIGGFEFKTVSVLPTELREKFINTVTNAHDDAEKVDTVLDCCAELMAEICVDEPLKDKDVWIKFNDTSGALVNLVHHMLQELVVSQEEIKTFR